MAVPVLHITGARPNFPKAAPVLRALAELGIAQRLVHTGQHYDQAMSEVFFRELGLPEPDVNLGVGSGSHATQTAAVMVELEQLFLRDPPQLVLVYGDVNSTVAAALVAAKLGITLGHVEAGLRSFDKTMPEEVNRVVTDRLADHHFATSADAVANLGNEGAHPASIHLVGNPMIDTLLATRPRWDRPDLAERWSLPDAYVVATVHRPSNVDTPAAAERVVAALHAVADLAPVWLPLHPRGRDLLTGAGLLNHPGLRVVEPMGYLDFVGLVNRSAAVITDSGGIQEETTLLGVPCLTLRANTERPVTITDGTNELIRLEAVPARVAALLAAGRPVTWPTPPLWDGHAGVRIARVIARVLGRSAVAPLASTATEDGGALLQR